MSTQKNYNAEYSDMSFWSKVKKHAKKAGSSILEPALQMYYALHDSDTPAWAKTTIVGALGYFISPVDLIPDTLPAIGLSDDLAVLTAAVATVAVHLKAEHKRLAQEKMTLWFK
ncbi:YkvA family protein [Paenalcaligenes sp.]|uniref:YkvA family protein n=1 Tax=Paenalcaligenes sp. TaxID=1966342 RepID=UPI0026395662|nr:YkvA family protein [Paenalcaligenes sp.]